MLDEIRSAVREVAGEDAVPFVLDAYVAENAGMDTDVHVVTSSTDAAALELCQVVQDLGHAQVIVEDVDGTWLANLNFPASSPSRVRDVAERCVSGRTMQLG